MKGSVGRTAVSYDAEGCGALAGAWLRLSLVDATTPPVYEADIWFGFDPKAGDCIVHRRDRYGAPARIVGVRHRFKRTLELEFPYAESRFRDTLALAADGKTGSLLIELIDPAGHVPTIASYTIARHRKSVAASVSRHYARRARRR